MTLQRSSGILLHPTCLPSEFGIGDLGQAAYNFVDFLVKSGQKFWQVLPLGPTGYEHSPYTMNYSAFAGNPLMINLVKLVDEGLLKSAELKPLKTSGETAYNRVDFDEVIPHKYEYLKLAFEHFRLTIKNQPNPELEKFCQEQAWWLDDYVLFMSLLEVHNGQAWNYWDKAIARRESQAIKEQKEVLKDLILYHQFLQFKFFEQWQALRKYANAKNIQIIGDVSIYVCHNSADVWASQENFALDPETLEAAWMAGVPPDYFSETGQLWGNPVYNWEHLQSTNYGWWIDRFKATLQYVDIVRIDHFRGFEAFWRIPAGETTGMKGEWIKAPGEDFFRKLGEALGNLAVLAEDLGIITPEVEELRDRFNFPGMRILMFAFGDDSTNPYLPHNYIPNCVVYPGTHDNDTIAGWWEKVSEKEKQYIAEYLGYSQPQEIKEINWIFIRMALASVANLAIIALQDVLDLDNRARMNDPSVNAGNWRWRFTDSDLLSEKLSDRLRKITQLYNR
ncbi:MAG: 4-alpha-glucanotransferase [Phormidium sp.]